MNKTCSIDAKCIISFDLNEQLMIIEQKTHTLNMHDNGLTFEQVTVIEQIICTSRQLDFQILWDNKSKIGLNTTANKLYHVNIERARKRKVNKFLLRSNTMSFEAIHELCKLATPSKMQKYKLAICLHKLYNIEFNPIEFYLLNNNQVVTSRQRNFIILKSNRTRVGLNSLANRLHTINGVIPLDWLNLSIETFKVRCKKLFL